MIPARNANLIEPAAGDDAERDAASDRTTYLDHLSDKETRIKALQAECFRVMAEKAALLAPPAAAPLDDIDDLVAPLAPDHPVRKAVKLMQAQAAEANARREASPEWMSIKDAAIRHGCTDSNMGGLRRTNKVKWRRDPESGRYSIYTPSIDKRLHSLGKTPTIPPPVVLHPHQLRRKS